MESFATIYDVIEMKILMFGEDDIQPRKQTLTFLVKGQGKKNRVASNQENGIGKELGN